NSSKSLPVNSFDASARAMSPPVAASSPSTAEGASPSNQGTTSRSVSMADNGEETQAICAAVVVEGIRLLSLMRLPAPSATGRMRTGARAAPPEGSSMNTILRRTIGVGVICLAVPAAHVVGHAQRDAKNPKEENQRPKLSL